MSFTAGDQDGHSQGDPHPPTNPLDRGPDPSLDRCPDGSPVGASTPAPNATPSWGSRRALGTESWGAAPWGRAGEPAVTARLRRQLAAILRYGVPPGPAGPGSPALPIRLGAPLPPPLDPSPTGAEHVDPGGRDWAQLDWPALLALAQAERLDTLLYTALLGAHAAGACPWLVRSALEAAYWRTKVANLLAFDAADQLTGALAAVDVPSVLLKGAALAFTLYPDPARRPIGDIDVLVHPEHVAVALRVLGLLGYAPAPNGPAASIVARIALGDARTLARRCQVTMLRGARDAQQLPMQVDLHWSLNSRALLRRTMDAAWFWDHVRPAAGAQPRLPGALRVLGDEAQLLHLCAHTLQHGIPRLRWTYDMALLLARRPLAWEVVLAGAERCGLGLAVQSSLAAVALIWGIVPPAWVEDRLAALPVSGAELRLRRAAWSGDDRAVAAGDLLSQPDLGSALDLWLAAVLPPAAYLQARYKMADPHLLPAYYLLHAVRGTVLGTLGALRLFARDPGAPSAGVAPPPPRAASEP